MTADPRSSATAATRFTKEDGAELRADLTITMNEVDKRLSLMDSDNKWMQRWVESIHPEHSPGGVVMDAPEPQAMPQSAPVAQMEFNAFNRAAQSVQQQPQYDLRSKREDK